MIARVDEIEFVGALVPRQPIGHANLAFERNELLLTREAIERSQPRLEDVMVDFWMRRRKMSS